MLLLAGLVFWLVALSTPETHFWRGFACGVAGTLCFVFDRDDD
jgi:hypothetical protein